MRSINFDRIVKIQSQYSDKNLSRQILEKCS